MSNYTKESVQKLLDEIKSNIPTEAQLETFRERQEKLAKECRESEEKMKREGGVMVRHYDCKNNPDFNSKTVRIEYNKDGRKETHHEEKWIDKTHAVVKSYDLIYDKDDNLIERVELGTNERTIDE
ncbi:MAG: hypothetical protein K6G73_01505 [Marinilabiliaceae bacterium]|nr:hypothetical protein [Marinilabiliaceae bacterium]